MSSARMKIMLVNCLVHKPLSSKSESDTFMNGMASFDNQQPTIAVLVLIYELSR